MNNPTTTQLTTLADAITHTRQRLKALTDTPGLDAQVLVSDITGRDKSLMLAHPEQRLSKAQSSVLDAALDELEKGVPLPYVLGEWEFYGMPFKLTQNVLIPRPETELLVETALDWLKNHPEHNRIIEVGVGSGCISVALAVNSSEVEITAIDISPEALAVAEINADHHQVSERITFLENDLLSDISGSFDMVCANLPYIPSKTLRRLPVYRREPSLALDGGKDGLVLIRRLLEQTPTLLNPGGVVLLEIEAGQFEKASEMAHQSIREANITLKRDLAGNNRLLVIETP